MTNRKLFHLQALRGLAASLVVLAHSIQGEYADRLWISGYFGVATFFIISGFIIYKTSSNAFGSVHGFRQFAIKRLIRIFPIYWIATLLFILLSPHRGEYTAIEIISSLTLIPQYMALTDGMNPLLGQAWTLHYEMAFYVIFAFGLLFNRRRGLIAICAILVLMTIIGMIIRPDDDSHGQLTLAQYWCRPIILLFSVGIGLGILEEYVRPIIIPFPFPIMIGILGVWFSYSLLSPLSEAQHYMFPHFLVVWGLCFVIVLVAIFGQSKPGVFETITEAFGDASYSVYLFHTFILSLFIRTGLREMHPVFYVVASLLGANFFGWAIYRMVEEPVLQKARTLLRPLL